MSLYLLYLGHIIPKVADIAIIVATAINEVSRPILTFHSKMQLKAANIF